MTSLNVSSKLFAQTLDKTLTGKVIYAMSFNSLYVSKIIAVDETGEKSEKAIQLLKFGYGSSKDDERVNNNFKTIADFLATYFAAGYELVSCNGNHEITTYILKKK